jgi:hypothetical protein
MMMRDDDDDLDLERKKNLALKESNGLLQEDNQDLTSKLEMALQHHHRDVTEMSHTIHDLEQRVMMLIQEKLNLQNAIGALEHQFVEVELKDTNNNADTNDKKKARGRTSAKNWMSDMLLSPKKEETKRKVTLDSLKSPKSPSSSPPPVVIINVDKDASQAEILRQTIIAHKRRDETFAARITGIFSNTGDSSTTNEEEDVKRCKSEFANFRRMSELSSEALAGAGGGGGGNANPSASSGSSPRSSNRSSNVSLPVAVGATYLTALRDVSEMPYNDEDDDDEEANDEENEDRYSTDHSSVEFDEGRASWSDARDSIMVGHSLFGDMDANESTRSSGSNQYKFLASAMKHKKETSVFSLLSGMIGGTTTSPPPVPVQQQVFDTDAKETFKHISMMSSGSSPARNSKRSSI